jgi:hypothetical protein
MGLGVELDPYDAFVPTPANWNLIFQRLNFMRPGFLRVVEPASDYFAGYDREHHPTYRWSGRHVQELLAILAYAKSRGITVVLGDWSDPLIHGDARIPAEFLAQLHDGYGFTNIRYYDPVNEPNYQSGCDFACWTGIVKSLSNEFSVTGISSWLSLVAPGNANSWDDTSIAAALDGTYGLDGDNPIGGDSWLTYTLGTIPGLVGAYDSHRYATVWGLQHGIYGVQMLSRRQQIDNVDSPSKPYFEGEVGLTARTQSPFGLTDTNLATAIDPSAHTAYSSFVDSQRHIADFRYGVWMADMMIQAIDAGLGGASAWDLDDAMHTGGQYGSQNLKRWGFWNSLGGQAGYPASDLEPRPWYYAWSLLARSFPHGSHPISMPATGIPGVRVAAAQITRGPRYDLSFAIVNDSDAPHSIIVTMPAAGRRINLTRYDYFKQDRPADANGFPVASAILHRVDLRRGLLVDLPARGLVVLSSRSAMRLNQGTQTLVDNLDNWGQVASHTRGLGFDLSAPAEFNDDGSRAVFVSPRTRRGHRGKRRHHRESRWQYLTYRRSAIKGFELKVYYRGSPVLRAYTSRNGRQWNATPLASTPPAPALGGSGWHFVELFPRAALSPGTSGLKLALSRGPTELSQVTISYR